MSVWEWMFSTCALNFGTFLVGISAFLGGAWGLYLYWREQGFRRARWLTDLYTRFYETSRYRKVRRLLDFEQTKELSRIIDKDRKDQELNGEEIKLFDRFTDYLNFFEYILYLKENGQVTGKDYERLFQYYLENLNKPVARDYILRPENGFELLGETLQKLPKPYPNSQTGEHRC